MDYDVLVLGSGIAGMESAIKLGDMGYRVLVVEKEASVGGKMVLLSKVFPTLDCASCISTPKMAATAHHPNITVMTWSEVERVRRSDGTFRVAIRSKPRFVDPALCTGCRLCEEACTVSVPDPFNAEMVARRAAHIPFPQAVPLKALIEHPGSSPCTFACPAGIKAHGYISLVRSGEYEKAFDLVTEATPLAGTLGRACYAPCESDCTRGGLEGRLPIRRLKRFVADRHYSAPDGGPIRPPAATGKSVAVVGSGPAGLTAAWQLARRGHRVKVFEAAPVAGGMLRLAIPSYRLPVEVVERDVRNLTDLGVEIETDHRVDDPRELAAQGFDAVLLAVGTPVAARLKVAGEELEGVVGGLDFLRAIKLGRAPDLAGMRVVVIGGGNVAIDAARSARRLGAVSVDLACLECRELMPAYTWEVDEALVEGVNLQTRWGVRGFTGSRQVRSVLLKRCTSVFDTQGRFRPEYDESVVHEQRCDLAVVAVGMGPERAGCGGPGYLDPDPSTLQTRVQGVFAAGDAVTGPTDIAHAVGHGRRAAFMIDRWLGGESLAGVVFDERLPAVAHDEVLGRQRTHSRREPVGATREIVPGPAGFAEIEAPLTEAEALDSAGRCLDCGVCSECGECLAVCPAGAIDFGMRTQDREVEVAAVILATGFRLFPADLKPQYGYGRFKNVITAMQMERLLAPTRPYHTVLRPGDGKVPEKIAYVMCTGSRDQAAGNPLCSSFCCMYSIKQNQLIMGALPLGEVTVHYIDVRTPGKGYDEFYEQARAMGATFVKGRVAEITEKEDGNLVLRYEDVEGGGGVAEAEYDLVVLAAGVQPAPGMAELFEEGELRLDDALYVDEPDEDLNPGATGIPGVYVAGAVSGAKDIPGSILHAGAAAALAAAHLERQKVPA